MSQRYRKGLILIQIGDFLSEKFPVLHVLISIIIFFSTNRWNFHWNTGLTSWYCKISSAMLHTLAAISSLKWGSVLYFEAFLNLSLDIPLESVLDSARSVPLRSVFLVGFLWVYFGLDPPSAIGLIHLVQLILWIFINAHNMYNIDTYRLL